MNRCPKGQHRFGKKCVDTLEYEGLYLKKGKIIWFGDYAEYQLPEAYRKIESLKSKGIKAGVFSKSLSGKEIKEIMRC